MQHFKRHAVSLSVMVALTAASGLSTSLTGMPSLIGVAHAQSSDASNSSAPLSSAQLQALVSPIALYPDSLLSTMLMASTYPLEVAEANNWYEANKSMTRDQIQAAMKPQTWDNSVKSLVLFPQALSLMGTQLGWTQNLGNAYLAQPKELMAAVQTLRARAQKSGNLSSNDQVKVTTEQSNIIIAPTNPQVIYVPQYNPTVVYGGWPYPAYPPAPVYNPAWGFMTFGVGLAVGAALWSTPHWNSGSININNNNFNNFNKNVNSFNNLKNERLGQDSNWKFNPTHRGNVPFNNAALSQRYGNLAQRDDAARSDIARNASNWEKNASPQERQRAQDVASRAQSDARSMDNRGLADRSSDDRSVGDRGLGDRSFGGGRGWGGGRSIGGFGGGHFGGGFRR